MCALPQTIHPRGLHILQGLFLFYDVTESRPQFQPLQYRLACVSLRQSSEAPPQAAVKQYPAMTT